MILASQQTLLVGVLAWLYVLDDYEGGLPLEGPTASPTVGPGATPGETSPGTSSPAPSIALPSPSLQP